LFFALNQDKKQKRVNNPYQTIYEYLHHKGQSRPSDFYVLEITNPPPKWARLPQDMQACTTYESICAKRGAKRQARNIQCHEKPEAILKGCRSDTRSGHHARIEWHKRAKQSQVLDKGR